MNHIVRVAEQVRARAEQEEAAAFDRQYQLARRTRHVLAAIEADGLAKARQWDEDDRRDEADRRFDPEPADAAEPAPAAPRASSAGARPRAGNDDEYEEDEPTTWLR